MKKFIIVLMVLSVIFITGCFSKEEKEEKIGNEQDVISALLEIVNSNTTRTTAGEVQNASNGVYSGVYLSIGGSIYSYNFTKIALFNGSEKTDFLNKWVSCNSVNSYIVFENKAITVSTAITAISNATKLSDEMVAGLSSNTTTFAIQPWTVVKLSESNDSIGSADRKDRKRKEIVTIGTDWSTYTSHGFHISKYEVTQGEFERIMGFNPSNNLNIGSNYPVENVTWYDAVMYCNKLSIDEGLTPYYDITSILYDGASIRSADVAIRGTNGYKLPNYDEWSWTSWGGRTTGFDYYIYSGSDNVNNVAWYGANSQNTTHLVGEKNINGAGIYDMSGNVWEWCETDPNVGIVDIQTVALGGAYNSQNMTECDVNGNGYKYMDKNEKNGSCGFRIGLLN